MYSYTICEKDVIEFYYLQIAVRACYGIIPRSDFRGKLCQVLPKI